MKIRTVSSLQEFGRVQDVFVINFDEASFTSLGSCCSQAAKGCVYIAEAFDTFIKAVIIHHILLNFFPASIGWKVNVSPPDTDNSKN